MQSVIPPLLAILDTSRRRETIEVVPMVFYYVSGKNPARCTFMAKNFVEGLNCCGKTGYTALS
jgi:hypothetical protein